jgi:hypothetical protein
VLENNGGVAMRVAAGCILGAENQVSCGTLELAAMLEMQR